MPSLRYVRLSPGTIGFFAESETSLLYLSGDDDLIPADRFRDDGVIREIISKSFLWKLSKSSLRPGMTRPRNPL